MNNRWCFSRPKLTHAQPEIYLKNHVKTHPCNPFMLLHMRHNGIAAAGDGAQIFHWKKKKNTPSRCPHSVVAIGGQTVPFMTTNHATSFGPRSKQPNFLLFNPTFFPHNLSPSTYFPQFFQ